MRRTLRRWLLPLAAALTVVSLAGRHLLSSKSRRTSVLASPPTPQTVLLWTPFFGKTDYIPPLTSQGCPELPCTFTSNRSALASSSAVIFHLRDTQPADLPTSRPSRSQVWVALHHESPHYTPRILTSLNGLINWTATYRRDSDIYLNPRLAQRQQPVTLPPRRLNKTRLVAWFVSNCDTPSRREAYVNTLRRTVSVDIYGSCGEKQCLPKMSRECLEKVSQEYYFYLSFENSICQDYVTEKFYDILQLDIVPVVLGGADYRALAPPGSYIDARDFEHPRNLGRFLLVLAKDPRRYRRYFAWKTQFYMTLDPYACQLCRKLVEPTLTPKVYQDLDSWWFTSAQCTTWKLAE
ncbi:FUT3 [Cordylochernes scorpioides]|uniref:Fucosyltransferase n=1 Tax=Cordylochernes scorpioides TaxID=51811 RepID=A0ABY6KU49_9ARAC|nr:FUT3 [Cordylochernes scorpioides]